MPKFVGVSVDMGAVRGVNGSDPTSSTDLATKNYVDEQSTNLITAAFGPVTSPIEVTVASGTFTAKSSAVRVSANLASIYYGEKVGNGVYILYVGPHGTTPLARATQSGSLQSGVQEISVGKAPQLAYNGVITGLTPGNSYDWALTVAIVGYYWGLPLPEAPTSISCSGLVSTLTNGQGTNLGGTGLAGESFPPFLTTMVAMGSATKLHILLASHVTGDPKDYLTTGAGFALRAGRTTGLVAVSPNGQKIAVSNYSKGNVDIFDVTNAANAAAPPVVTAATTFTTNNPFALAWAADNSTLYVVQYAASGTGQWQKITGANGASPAVGSAQNLDANALGIVAAQVTPDGTKLVTASGTYGYIVNTSTNAVTTFTLPTSVVQGAVVMSNTLAYAVSPSNTTLYSINLSTGGVTAVNSALSIPTSGIVSVVAQPDGNSLFVFTNAASGQVIQLDLRTGQTIGNKYTSWGNPTSAGGGAVGAVGVAAISALGDFFVTQASYLNVWPGGQVLSLGAGFGHVGSVNFTPAA